MRLSKVLASAVVMLLATYGTSQDRQSRIPGKPRLVLTIMIDQFREDYLTRFRNEYKGGFSELLSGGAVFPDAHQDHFPTVTAVGHTTVLTGSVPATSGIIGNEWYDRRSGKVVTSVEDASSALIGDPSGEGASPHNLVVSTVGDELKIAHHSDSRVIGISLKDRAAILMVGRMADAAYWFDPATGGFVTSSWYENKLPAWVNNFNQNRFPEHYLGKAWNSSETPNRLPFVRLPETPSKAFYSAWEGTPYANEVLERFAEATLQHEHLGQHQVPDVLAVSFSANDVLGHRVGPDAPEVQEMCLQTDHIIGKLLKAAERQVGGPENLLVVFTSDHGVAPVPEVNVHRRLPGTRIDTKGLLGPIQAGLQAKYGQGEWIQANEGGDLYLNSALILKKGLSEADVEDQAARLAMTEPNVFRVYTRHEFEQHYAMQSGIDEYMARGFFAERSGDVSILMRPYSVYASSGTGHGTPFDYDSHVPLIFYGWRIKPWVYTDKAGISDVAPTLAYILSVETPSGSIGHILDLRTF